MPLTFLAKAFLSISSKKYIFNSDSSISENIGGMLLTIIVRLPLMTGLEPLISKADHRVNSWPITTNLKDTSLSLLIISLNLYFIQYLIFLNFLSSSYLNYVKNLNSSKERCISNKFQQILVISVVELIK